jgi:hypothetical protein
MAGSSGDKHIIRTSCAASSILKRGDALEEFAREWLELPQQIEEQQRNQSGSTHQPETGHHDPKERE